MSDIAVVTIWLHNPIDNAQHRNHCDSESLNFTVHLGLIYNINMETSKSATIFPHLHRYNRSVQTLPNSSICKPKAKEMQWHTVYAGLSQVREFHIHL